MRTTAPNLDLKRERFRQQMSRTALSHQSGISRKALLDIETGRRRPRMNTASQIAKALDCEVHEIFNVAEVIG
jgi:DNA-binding XRE family transcriptional regulator